MKSLEPVSKTQWPISSPLHIRNTQAPEQADQNQYDERSGNAKSKVEHGLGHALLDRCAHEPVRSELAKLPKNRDGAGSRERQNMSGPAWNSAGFCGQHPEHPEDEVGYRDPAQKVQQVIVAMSQPILGKNQVNANHSKRRPARMNQHTQKPSNGREIIHARGAVYSTLPGQNNMNSPEKRRR